MRQLLFATTNRGKLAELRELVGESVRVLSLSDFPSIPEAVEDGLTFEANALKKARYYGGRTGLASLADDSGLCVDALGGAPGVRSARYVEGSDEDRYRAVLAAMVAVEPPGRTAAFVCVLALHAGSAEATAEGRCPGFIGDVPRGSNGFGYDPVFVLPDGRTMAELTREEKAAVSHRGQAFSSLQPTLLRFARGDWPEVSPK